MKNMSKMRGSFFIHALFFELQIEKIQKDTLKNIPNYLSRRQGAVRF